MPPSRMQKWWGIFVFLNERASIFYPKNTNFRVLADLSIVGEDSEKRRNEREGNYEACQRWEQLEMKFSSLLHREVNNIIFKKEIYCVSFDIEVDFELPFGCDRTIRRERSIRNSVSKTNFGVKGTFRVVFCWIWLSEQMIFYRFAF